MGRKRIVIGELPFNLHGILVDLSEKPSHSWVKKNVLFHQVLLFVVGLAQVIPEAIVSVHHRRPLLEVPMMYVVQDRTHYCFNRLSIAEILLRIKTSIKLTVFLAHFQNNI